MKLFSTISGLETFGDNQFVTAITAFPVLRNQEKYQFRYDLSHVHGRHAPRFGVNFIHEPVLSGALTATAETVLSYTNDPSFYAANPSQFYFSSSCAPPVPANVACEEIPAGDGSFSQNVQRLGIYAQDSWRATPRLTINYGLRYDTTFGLFRASGHDQNANPALTGNGMVSGIPHDYRKAFAPRLGVAYGLDSAGNTVLRGGIGLYFNDLAQNGWVEAFNAVNNFNIQNASGPPSLIDLESDRQQSRIALKRWSALVAGFPIRNDALSQGDVRQHSASGSTVVRHMRWISRTGNHAGNGRVGENEFQQYLCPASAAHLACPLRQRPVA